MSGDLASAGAVVSRRKFLAPLALAQFICSFAGSNMNVMINDITEDLDTTVTGVQAAITLFLLIMAVLMIPASKLSDRWGRKRCFTGVLLCLTIIGIPLGLANFKLIPVSLLPMGREIVSVEQARAQNLAASVAFATDPPTRRGRGF